MRIGGKGGNDQMGVDQGQQYQRGGLERTTKRQQEGGGETQDLQQQQQQQRVVVRQRRDPAVERRGQETDQMREMQSAFLGGR